MNFNLFDGDYLANYSGEILIFSHKLVTCYKYYKELVLFASYTSKTFKLPVIIHNVLNGYPPTS